VLIDCHAHFYQPASSRADWAERNAARLAAGEQIGIRWHVASILGTWGRTSPTYFPSTADVSAGNDALLELARQHPDRIKAYACVNPNYPEHAVAEIDRCVNRGMIGIKLAASRRCDDPLVDVVAAEAARRRLPILQHIWQHRRREWPGQEASDGAELVTLARRHPTVAFLLAHIGGGGDWIHTLHAVTGVENVFVDLSGSGVDGGMLEACLDAVGVGRMIWGADLTLDTGLAKLRRLERLLSADEMDRVRYLNAAAIFPPGAFGASPW
jgi:predicted TIM-barrel fold metal-dependent hydrolase